MDKTKQIQFRATPDDIARWKRAADATGKTLSDICRASLERLARRIEKNGGGDE